MKPLNEGDILLAWLRGTPSHVTHLGHVTSCDWLMTQSITNYKSQMQAAAVCLSYPVTEVVN